MEASLVFEMFRKFEEVVETYGPFEFIDAREARDVSPEFIWSVGEFDDGEHLINGFLNGSEIDWHFKAAQTCLLNTFEAAVVSVYCFSCIDCNGESDCEVCDDEGMVEVDFQRYSLAVDQSDASPESIWAFRKPLGFDYS